MGSEYYHGWGGMMGFGHPILFLVIIAIILYFIFGRKCRSKHSKSALDIAKERYAKGDITKEEFEQIKKDISD